MSFPKLIFILFFAPILFLSCSREEIITIEETTIDSTISKPLKTANIKVYHFITFDSKNPRKFREFISKITKLAKQKNGKILTKGISGNCVERKCSKVNFVIEFDSSSSGNLFFKNYKRSLDFLSKNITKNLSYIVSSSETIPELIFNEDIKTKAYVIAKINVTSREKLDNFYSTPAAISLIESNGNYMVLDPNQQCRIGKCPKSMVLIGFESTNNLRKWYFSETYQSIIPIRLSATAGGGVFLTD